MLRSLVGSEMCIRDSRNQIDFIIVHKKPKPQIKDSRVFNSASIGSDHSLVLARFKISIKQKRKFYPKRVPKKFYVERLLTDPELANEFRIKIGGRFEPLLNLDTDEIDTDELYDRFKGVLNTVTKETVGFCKRKLVENMPPDVEKMCEKRKVARLQSLSQPLNLKARQQYQSLNREVKKSIKDLQSSKHQRQN